jgi:hypothetical protein
MSTITAPRAPAQAPLDEVMLAMDVVDTLRHRQDLVERELAGEAREEVLLEKLREIYRHQGIEVPDAVLREGVKALKESRFAYTPPKPSFETFLARAYVARKIWAPGIIAAALILIIGVGGYFLAYRPIRDAQIEAARVELAETLPAQMDQLYAVIYEETKVQQAVGEAEALRTRGKAAAAEGNRGGAEQAIADLTALRDQLRQQYSLRIVSRPGVQSGFWRIPDVNTEATNYYLVVEAIGPEGRALPLPILSEEDGQTETVSMWGVRVPESVYRAVEADKREDGIVQRSVVGVKQFGFLDVDYAMPVLGGAVTEW